MEEPEYKFGGGESWRYGGGGRLSSGEGRVHVRCWIGIFGNPGVGYIKVVSKDVVSKDVSSQS